MGSKVSNVTCSAVIAYSAWMKSSTGCSWSGKPGSAEAGVGDALALGPAVGSAPVVGSGDTALHAESAARPARINKEIKVVRRIKTSFLRKLFQCQLLHVRHDRGYPNKALVSQDLVQSHLLVKIVRDAEHLFRSGAFQAFT